MHFVFYENESSEHIKNYALRGRRRFAQIEWKYVVIVVTRDGLLDSACSVKVPR